MSKQIRKFLVRAKFHKQTDFGWYDLRVRKDGEEFIVPENYVSKKWMEVIREVKPKGPPPKNLSVGSPKAPEPPSAE